MSFAEIRRRLAGRPPLTIALAAADDPAALAPLADARAAGLAEPLLFGDPAAVEAAAAEAGIDLTGIECLPAASPAEAAALAVRAVAEGRADLVMKGHVPTPVLLKAALDPELGFRASRLLSHIAAFELPRYDRLLFLTDTGMVLRPDLAEKELILANAVNYLRRLGVAEPAVAVLSATEVPNPKMPDSLNAARLAELAAAGRFGACQVCGPVDVSIALDPEAARVKGVECPISGRADIWLVPEMVGGNILGKALIGLAGADAGGVVVGGASPIILLSRASSPSDKANSILLGLAACTAKGDA